MLWALLVLPLVLSFDAIIDLGAGSYQVGTLKKSALGNPIELILNKHSKRMTPTLVAYDGESFHVGENALILQRRSPGVVFKGFLANLTDDALAYAADPTAEELAPLRNKTATVLLTALMNHIAANQIRRPDETIDVTLIASAGKSLAEINALKGALEAVPKVKLLTTVPTPSAIVTSIIKSSQNVRRYKDRDTHFVIVDIGTFWTEVSLVRVHSVANTSDFHVDTVDTVSVRKGGDAITERLIDARVVPRIPGYTARDFRLHKRIFEAVEKAKITLSANTDAKATVEACLPGGEDLAVVLTREDLAAAVADLFDDETMHRFERIRAAVEDVKALHAADDAAGEGGDAAATDGGAYRPVNYVFYGGGSRVLPLQAVFERYLASSISKIVNADEGAIYGAGLVAAKYGKGLKVAYRFMTSDYTRPTLMLSPPAPAAGAGADVAANGTPAADAPAPLMRLNPFIRKTIVEDLADVPAEFATAAARFNVSYMKETRTTGEDGRTSSSVRYDTDTMNTTVLTTRALGADSADGAGGAADTAGAANAANASAAAPTAATAAAPPLYTLDMHAADVVNMTCVLRLPPFDAQAEILDKYAKRSHGQIKHKFLKDIAADAERYANRSLHLADLLAASRNGTLDSDAYRVKLVVNITTDASSIPNVSYAAVVVLDNTRALEHDRKAAADALRRRRQDKSKDKDKDAPAAKKRPKPVVHELLLDVACDAAYAPALAHDAAAVAADYELVRSSDRILAIRKEYESSVNDLEGVLYAIRELLEAHPPAAEDAGDHVVYASEGASLRALAQRVRAHIDGVHAERPCGPDVECVNERLRRVDAFLTEARAPIEAVAERVRQIDCRPDALATLNETVAKFETVFAELQAMVEAADRLQVPQAAPQEPQGFPFAAPDSTPRSTSPSPSPDANTNANANASANATANANASTTAASSTSARYLRAMRVCREIEGIDVDTFTESYRTEKAELEGRKDDIEARRRQKSWFTRVLSAKREDAQLKSLADEVTYSKNMIVRLRKAVASCRTMARLHTDLAEDAAGASDELDESRAVLVAAAQEPAHRPATACAALAEHSTELAIQAKLVHKHLREFLAVADKARLDNLADELLSSSLVARAERTRADRLHALLRAQDYARAAETLAGLYNVSLVAEDVRKGVEASALLADRLQNESLSDSTYEVFMAALKDLAVDQAGLRRVLDQLDTIGDETLEDAAARKQAARAARDATVAADADASAGARSGDSDGSGSGSGSGGGDPKMEL